MYIIQYVGRSACRPMVTVSFWCSGMSSQLETTFFGSGIRQVVASDVCVSTDFVQYCGKSKFGSL